MKTVLAFIAGVVVGAIVGTLSVIAGMLQDDDTNHNGYQFEARSRGDV